MSLGQRAYALEKGNRKKEGILGSGLVGGKNCLTRGFRKKET